MSDPLEAVTELPEQNSDDAKTDSDCEQYFSGLFCRHRIRGTVMSVKGQFPF